MGEYQDLNLEDLSPERINTLIDSAYKSEKVSLLISQLTNERNMDKFQELLLSHEINLISRSMLLSIMCKLYDNGFLISGKDIEWAKQFFFSNSKS